jgi:hypothetical protein
MRVCFGHQSVGAAIVTALATMTGRGIEVVETSDPKAFQRPVFAHFRVGRNGDPLSKCRAFARAMEAGSGDRADVAFFKLCYVDITAATDVDDLFRTYQDTMASLVLTYPDVTFLHVTVPLTRVPCGPVGWWRKRMGWIGRAQADQMKRHAFNTMVRAAYAASGRLFDLAEVEATFPDGTPSRFLCHGESIPTLVPEYTDDGGHLTQQVAELVAGRLLSCLEIAAGHRTRNETRRPEDVRAH